MGPEKSGFIGIVGSHRRCISCRNTVESSIAPVLMATIYPIEFILSQFVPPILTRRWESSPDFKAFLGKSGGSNSRGGWATPSGSGRGMNAGLPSFAGSPGRSELARGIRFSSRSGSVEDIKISSPQHQPQVRLPVKIDGLIFTITRCTRVPVSSLFLHDFSVPYLTVCLSTPHRHRNLKTWLSSRSMGPV